mgnify:CR=1 FL=1
MSTVKSFVIGTLGLMFIIFIWVYFFADLGLTVKENFGQRNANIEQKIFKKSTPYIEGMLDDLAKYKYELQQEESKSGKKAIADLINDRFANFDENAIESADLKQFLADVRNGKY